MQVILGDLRKMRVKAGENLNAGVTRQMRVTWHIWFCSYMVYLFQP